MHYWRTLKGLPYYPDSDRMAYFTTNLNSFSVQRAIPEARGTVTSPSPHRICSQYRNINLLSIGDA